VTGDDTPCSPADGRAGVAGDTSTDLPALSDIDKATAAALANYRQGDLLIDVTCIPVVGEDGQPRAYATSIGSVLLSQTCDVVLPDRLTVHASPLIRLSKEIAAQARDGKRPRYVHVPAAGEDAFADLEVIGTLTKAYLATRSHTAGVVTDDDIRRFGRAVGRRFGRFAFPDEVVHWLAPLQDTLASKAGKPASHEGQALAHVAELRIEAAGGWLNPPYELTLAVIVQPGTLPTFPDDELLELPPALEAWLYTDDRKLKRTAGDIASRLAATTDNIERYSYWMALGEAWADRCYPKGTPSKKVLDSVASLIAEIVPADEYMLTRYRRSEQLDLDHLSVPTPE